MIGAPGGARSRPPPSFLFSTKAGQIRREALFLLSLSLKQSSSSRSHRWRQEEICGYCLKRFFLLFVHKLAVRWEVVVHVR